MKCPLCKYEMTFDDKDDTWWCPSHKDWGVWVRLVSEPRRRELRELEKRELAGGR